MSILLVILARLIANIYNNLHLLCYRKRFNLDLLAFSNINNVFILEASIINRNAEITDLLWYKVCL